MLLVINPVLAVWGWLVHCGCLASWFVSRGSGLTAHRSDGGSWLPGPGTGGKGWAPERQAAGCGLEVYFYVWSGHCPFVSQSLK